MIVGVAGLGHIGGSMAKAAGRFTPHRVLGLDADPSTERAALEEGAIDGVLADPTTVPAGEESLFVEKVWRLPEIRYCFTPPEPAPMTNRS